MTSQFAMIVYLMGFIAYLIPVWYDESNHYGHTAKPGTWGDVFDAFLWPATMFARADDEFRKTRAG